MNNFPFLQASCYCFVLLSPIIFWWLLFYFFLIHCHIWSYQSKKSFQEQKDHQEHLVCLCIFPRFGAFSTTVYECFSTFISQTTLWSRVNNIISTYQLETVMHKENEWLLEATQEQWVQKWVNAEVQKWSGLLMPSPSLICHGMAPLSMGEVKPETHAALLCSFGSAGHGCHGWGNVLAVRLPKIRTIIIIKISVW